MFANAPRAGLIRRLAAIMYDWLILAALWMAAMALALLVVALLNSTGIISLANYTDHADFITQHKLWFQLYSVLCFFWFYLYFWCKGGQTLGMRAWRLLLVQQNGEAISLKQAVLRAFSALLGLGNIWLWLRWGKGLACKTSLRLLRLLFLPKNKANYLICTKQPDRAAWCRARLFSA